MTPAHLHEFFKMVKKNLKPKCQGPVLVYINELPASPCTYQNKYPEMFSAASPDNPPVRCPFPMEVVAQVNESITMRSNKNESHA